LANFPPVRGGIFALSIREKAAEVSDTTAAEPGENAGKMKKGFYIFKSFLFSINPKKHRHTL
jgi:hypothetical protein